MQSITTLTSLCAMILTSILSGYSCAAFAAGAESSSAEERQFLMQNGIARSYMVRVPPAMDKAKLLPLVLVLHGGGGSAANAEKITGFTEKAAKEGFIVAYPEGSSRFRHALLTWNAGHCCGYAMEQQVDDVAFINALLDKLIMDYPVDPKRLYVTGMSNGGMMTERLGIALSNRFAAIAPVVATLFGDEKNPDSTVSAIIFNGLLDKSVPNRGGQSSGRFANAWDGTPAKPAMEQPSFWAAANACNPQPEQHDHGSYVQWQYHCPQGRAVEFYLVNDNGHAWPGGQKGSRKGDEPSRAINATDVIWAFFKAHAKN